MMWLVISIAAIRQISALGEELSSKELDDLYKLKDKYKFEIPLNVAQARERFNEVLKWDIRRFDSRKRDDQAILLYILGKVIAKYIEAEKSKLAKTGLKTATASNITSSQKSEHPKEATTVDSPYLVSSSSLQASDLGAASRLQKKPLKLYIPHSAFNFKGSNTPPAHSPKFVGKKETKTLSPPLPEKKIKELPETFDPKFAHSTSAAKMQRILTLGPTQPKITRSELAKVHLRPLPLQYKVDKPVFDSGSETKPSYELRNFTI